MNPVQPDPVNNPNKYHPIKPDGTLDERVWIADMGKQVGTNGEQHIKIVVDALTTAFPFIP